MYMVQVLYGFVTVTLAFVSELLAETRNLRGCRVAFALGGRFA